jgi:hypothetical protein
MEIAVTNRYRTLRCGVVAASFDRRGLDNAARGAYAVRGKAGGE